jgi:KTSC domain
MMSRRVYTPESSNVEYFCYDDEEYVLEIGFKWGGVYAYSHCPAKVWYRMQAAPSKGKYVWEELRNSKPYPYELQNYGPEEVVSEYLVPPEPTKPKKKWWQFFER